MSLYGPTIFLSALLLFQLQPLMAKMILPWFGGSAAVWITCLLFFQIVLVLGYLYAHLLIRRVPLRIHRWIHIFLLGISLLLLPILPAPATEAANGQDPAVRILALLATSIGLPYFLLSSTTPLVQAWYSRAARENPYAFFAVSNAGSLLGLLSYPMVMEPLLTTRQQALVWSLAYAGLCVVCANLAFRTAPPAPAKAEEEPEPPPDLPTRLLWVALAACAAALLFGVTNHLTQNVAAMPFLWVLPLSLYLMSFVFCFGGVSWYRGSLFLKLLGVALGAMAYGLAPEFGNTSLRVLVPLYSAGLFVCCMFCHGELARLKPPAQHLTSFYFLVALGGALGGLYVSGLAPRHYRDYFEFPIALGGLGVLALFVLRHDPESRFYRARWQASWLVLVGLVLALMAGLYRNTQGGAAEARVMARNFYGSLRVVDLFLPRDPGRQPDQEQRSLDALLARELFHGTVVHGLQFLSSNRRQEPTSYFIPGSGVGLALREAAGRGPVRVGVVGLGTGTLAAYGRQGDSYRFYDINPLVIRLAQSEFTFLRDSQARVEIVLGDARLSLQREPPQNFDVLAVDAFSGAAIPLHLLTREAFALYFRHLRAGGVLAMHISNQHLDLQPVVRRVADSLGKRAVVVENAADSSVGAFQAVWVLLSDREAFFGDPEIRKAARPVRDLPGLAVWTDEYSNLLRVLR